MTRAAAPPAHDARFRAVGDGRYRLTVPGQGLEFDVDHLRRERHELIGELAVSCGMLGARTYDGYLSIGSFNLSSPRARQDRAKTLAERSRTGGALDWLDLLEQLCQGVLLAERAGSPAVELRTVAPEVTETTMMEVHGLRLSRRHPAILFGDGGTLKSYLALDILAGLERQGVRTLYCDWELDAQAHRARLARLCGDALPGVHYLRCERPLVLEAEALRRVVRDQGIGYLVCDSVAFGCDGPPEAAESAMAYFRALRQVGVGALLIAHTVKNGSDTAEHRPFGSAFWHNSARATWYVQLAAPASDTERELGLFNRKQNLGPLQRAIGLRVVFEEQRTVIRRLDLTSVADLAAELPLWQRVRHAVAGGPMTLARLADELGAKVDTLDRTVRRHAGVFTRVDGSDGVSRVALLHRGIA